MLRFEICKTHGRGEDEEDEEEDEEEERERGRGRGLTCPVNATRSIAHATPLNRVSTGKG